MISDTDPSPFATRTDVDVLFFGELIVWLFSSHDAFAGDVVSGDAR